MKLVGNSDDFRWRLLMGERRERKDVSKERCQDLYHVREYPIVGHC
jgi:hypothetical protein